jgi:predicted 3-demethylubiquinone-9 3-methyltransferase (glyoxalase superfamily)
LLAPWRRHDNADRKQKGGGGVGPDRRAASFAKPQAIATSPAARTSLDARTARRGRCPMSKISPCLWFANDAEQAANFYVSLVPDSRIDRVQRSPVDTPSGKAGEVLVVGFTLAGQSFIGLNGGSVVPYTNAVSFTIHCDDQAEVDRLWDALSADGGKPIQCGWITDRWGVPWQIVPNGFMALLAGSDSEGAKRAMTAMMGMVKLDLAALKKAYDGS